MPKLNTSLHLDMYQNGKNRRSFWKRLKKAYEILIKKDHLYGLEWGDPENVPHLAYVKEHFILPYISKEANVLEIGPGGGRWTRYMLASKLLVVIDYHQELLDELKLNFNGKNMIFVKNNGDDFPNIKENSIDFLFSFGTFVHLDIEIIDRYLKNMYRIIKNSSNVVIQYSDKNKPLAILNEGFSDNNPTIMRNMVQDNGYIILEEDIGSLPHSSIIRFTKTPS